MTERKLASIRVIEEIKFIEGADSICAYRVGGWWVVDQISKYSIGSKVIYVEIDSWLPHELAPFLSKGKEPREFEGIKGERLRTIRLRGQVSQGLLLPLEPTCSNIEIELFEGLDVTYPLGIVKYEKPIPAQLAGLIRGNFPSEIPKTDQERIQNLTERFNSFKQYTWTVTEKLDGTSCTFYLDKDGDFHVCSRNLDLKRDENNTYWRVAVGLGIEQAMRDRKDFGIALQGEIIGEGIQGNQYKCKPVFKAFDVFFDGEYGSQSLLKTVSEGEETFDTVPVLYTGFKLGGFDIESLLKFADGKSQLNDSIREGLVFQCEQDSSVSFKVVSDQWLLKYE